MSLQFIISTLKSSFQLTYCLVDALKSFRTFLPRPFIAPPFVDFLAYQPLGVVDGESPNTLDY